MASSPFPRRDPRDPSKVEAWILGSGLPSLTAAVHLIQEAGVPPSRVHILEKLSMAGGGTVSYGDATNGYDFRAGGLPQFNDVCMEHLLSLVPSTTRPGRTVLDDLVAYNEENPLKEASHTRFLSHKSYGLSRTDPKKVNLGLRDRVDLFMLTSKTEKSLGRTRINEYLSESFFKSNYWLMLATTYGPHFFQYTERVLIKDTGLAFSHGTALPNSDASSRASCMISMT
jgi:oleate hydratase